jgi:hypothetical protein
MKMGQILFIIRKEILTGFFTERTNVHLANRIPESNRSGDRVVHWILFVLKGTKDSHEAVTNVLVQNAIARKDNLDQALEKVVQQVNGLLWVLRFGHAGSSKSNPG